MRIISVKALKQFAKKHPDLRQALNIWIHLVEKADWKSPAEVRRLFNTADFLADNRVVFDLGGNKYRMICVMKYPYRIVYVRFIGTHKDYDRIDATTI